MKSNHGKYNVLIYYSGDYLSGSFYDAVEYTLFFQDQNINTGLLILVDIPEKDIMMTINNRYQRVPENLHIEKQQKNHIYKYFSKTLITTSIFSCADIMNGKWLLPVKRLLVMQETTDSDYIQKTFAEQQKHWLDKITVLRDERDTTIHELQPYKHINYKKKLYFNAFKPITWLGYVEKNCLINLSTKHKLYEPVIIRKIMRKFKHDHYLLYCQKDTYPLYKKLRSSRVDVVIAPLKNYLNRFNSFIYIQSKRNDPSPRIMPECMFYKKKLHFYEFEKKYDGAYWRWIDCQNDWKSLVLEKRDKLLTLI